MQKTYLAATVALLICMIICFIISREISKGYKTEQGKERHDSIVESVGHRRQSHGFAESVGKVNEEVIRKYTKTQK